MSRPIRSSVLAWLALPVPGVDAAVGEAEVDLLETYEARWDALLAMPPGDPGAEALLKTLSAHVNRWQAAGDPILFPAIHAERLALRAEADRVLGQGQLLVAINETPL